MKLINEIYKVLILGLILILSLCLFTNFASEIKLVRMREDLGAYARLEDKKEVFFKLSLNSNRPKIQERSLLSYFRPDRSFSTRKWKVYDGDFCHQKKVSQKVFLNSLTFQDDFKVKGIQLVASKRQLGTNQIFSGILGLNPMSTCNEHLQDPNAIINVLRQKDKGYTINLPKLTFTSEFPSASFTKYDGYFFQIVQFGYDSFASDQVFFNAKIDLDSNEIKIPRKAYESLRSEGFFQTSELDKNNEDLYFSGNYWIGTPFVDTSGKEAWLKLPNGEKIWLSKWKNVNFINLNSQNVYMAHDEDYWSFGLYFLDRFAVSFNVEDELIYIERK